MTMLVRIAMIAFIIGLASWAFWSVYADWRKSRVPAAVTFTKVHYAKRSEVPVVFWGLTISRAAVVVYFIWQGAIMVFQLLTAR